MRLALASGAVFKLRLRFLAPSSRSSLAAFSFNQSSTVSRALVLYMGHTCQSSSLSVCPHTDIPLLTTSRYLPSGGSDFVLRLHSRSSALIGFAGVFISQALPTGAGIGVGG